MKVMIVVTHLLGTGHLARALTLARAFQAAGDTVTVVSGGLPVTQLDSGDVNLVQMPPVRSDGVNFAQLLTQDGKLATEQTLKARQKILCETLATTQPDALITELFPFGRRILKAEFMALLDAAHAQPRRPCIFASIRDILAAPSKPEKAQATEAILSTKYDRVLVHSVASVMPLNLSWPVTPTLEQKLQYTGFVAPPPPSLHPDHLGKGEVLVSAGGGDVGMPLFKAVVAAAAHMTTSTFRLLVGGSQAQAHCAILNQDAPRNLKAEPARPDFRMMLNHAAASVSLCGYNTALDVLQTGCPAVFLPFDAGGEVEQSIRALALTGQDGIEMIENNTLSAGALITALKRVLAAPARAPMTSGVDGATTTRQIVSGFIEQKQ